jgi:formate-dependent nitrite reductase cytochrome c552 subunit
VIVSEHDYITFVHGPTHDNNYCFNCHDYDQMNRLRTRHQTLTFEESNLLCASCHGTTYRDWLADAHGRTSGYWNLSMGERTRLDCTECHDPHDTRFPSLKPAPGPHSLQNRIILDPNSQEN